MPPHTLPEDSRTLVLSYPPLYSVDVQYSVLALVLRPRPCPTDYCFEPTAKQHQAEGWTWNGWNHRQSCSFCPERPPICRIGQPVMLSLPCPPVPSAHSCPPPGPVGSLRFPFLMPIPGCDSPRRSESEANDALALMSGSAKCPRGCRPFSSALCSPEFFGFMPRCSPPCGTSGSDCAVAS